MRYQYLYNGETYTIDLQPGPDGRYTAVIGNQTLIVTPQQLPDGGWRLRLNGEMISGYSAAEGSTRYIALNGETFILTIPDARVKRRNPGGGDLTAQMPGQVIAVLVNEGESVEQGQPLMILEAMKMEIRVAAPVAGTVKKLLVTAGEVVERGQILAEIEPIPPVQT
jgi:3-methylcrotonyl-CoA carboxylase alpha subunit